MSGRFILDTNIVIAIFNGETLLDKGKPIPENDIWIAAVAMQNNLILVTRDGHFDQIEELKCEKW